MTVVLSLFTLLLRFLKFVVFYYVIMLASCCTSIRYITCIKVSNTPFLVMQQYYALLDEDITLWGNRKPRLKTGKRWWIAKKNYFPHRVY